MVYTTRQARHRCRRESKCTRGSRAVAGPRRVYNSDTCLAACMTSFARSEHNRVNIRPLSRARVSFFLHLSFPRGNSEMGSEFDDLSWTLCIFIENSARREMEYAFQGRRQWNSQLELLFENHAEFFMISVKI